MIELPFFQVDAFTAELFGGNPAAVCLLETWPTDEVLQAVAAENNLSETAFLLAGEDPVPIRWFTPAVEVPLCGHATLASAFVMLTRLRPEDRAVRFLSRAHGELAVTALDDGLLELDFPALPPAPLDNLEEANAVRSALGVTEASVWWADDFYLVELANEAAVAGVAPDLAATARLDRHPIVTARGSSCDFVSRFFAPGAGIDEDPVTGSAHCVLAPFWAARLERATLLARQISKRGGELRCAVRGDRVGIAGRAVLFAEGKLRLPSP